MGKPTGFMEYERKDNAAIEPLERIKNFNEFHAPMREKDRKEQAARCMNCGVPFCQSGMMIGGMASGCPLNNLVPEWNDLIYRGNYEKALQMLRQTNNFPEFTSRVCPALCEAACTCGLHDTPVTCKERKLYCGVWISTWLNGSKSTKGTYRKEDCDRWIRPFRTCGSRSVKQTWSQCYGL